MDKLRKLLSAFLSCTIACASGITVVPKSTSSYSAADSYAVYDNINQEESKEVSQEEPFHVFDIYNAYIPKK